MRQIFARIAASAFILGLTAAPVAAQLSCEMGTPAPDMPDEFNQFDFIIGDFVVHARRGAGDGWTPSIVLARWNGRYDLGGKAVSDYWHDRNASGLNIRLYDPEAGLWKTAWHHTGSFTVTELHQKIDPETGHMKLWQVYPEAAERNIHFETYADGRWARIEKRRDEQTGEWTNFVKLEAVPTACVPGQSHIIPE